MAHGYRKGGWRNKYHIAKWDLDDDGNIQGLRFTDEDAQYFVMRFDKDPHARVAMRAYADSVARENPDFAGDIRRQLLDSSDTEGAGLERNLA